VSDLNRRRDGERRQVRRASGDNVLGVLQGARSDFRSKGDPHRRPLPGVAGGAQSIGSFAAIVAALRHVDDLRDMMRAIREFHVPGKAEPGCQSAEAKDEVAADQRRAP